MTTVLTPAFSVKTVAWRALASSQSPKALPPVKSTRRTSERVASVAASEGERQHGGRVRLDHDRVAGDQAGEEPRPGVPRREGVAADHQRDAARHDGERLLHRHRHLARLLPERGARRTGHLDPCVGDGLERTVEGVGAAGLEGHHEGLSAGVLDGVRELEDAGVEPVEDLDADADPRLGPGIAPALHTRAGGGQQRVDVGDVGVGDAEVEAVRRPLGRHDVLAASRGVDREGRPLPGLERRLALGGRGLAVHARRRRLVERRVVLPRRTGGHRRVEAFTVLVEVGGRHPATMTRVTAVRKRGRPVSHAAATGS
jgi:hypothetical protein